jgi:hypothetical protein
MPLTNTNRQDILNALRAYTPPTMNLHIGRWGIFINNQLIRTDKGEWSFNTRAIANGKLTTFLKHNTRLGDMNYAERTYGRITIFGTDIDIPQLITQAEVRGYYSYLCLSN